MTDVEKHALSQELHSPRGRVLLTFLKESAMENAMVAMKCDNAEQSFALLQRGAGLMEAHAQLEAIANEPITGAYGGTD